MTWKAATFPGVSIVMPTFNEAGNIGDLMCAAVSNLKAFGVDAVEVIVVDDDSPDLTWQVAEQTECGAPTRVIRRMANHGLTLSLNEGIAAASNDVVIWFDCDFSHPPECIPQLIFMLNQGFDVVVNSRYVVGGGEDRAGKGGALQLFLSRLLNWGIRFLLYPSFSDYTSGFIAVRRSVFNNMSLRGDYGEYFVDFIFRVLHRKEFRVCELPYVALPRRSGESKTGSNIFDYVRRGSKYLWTVMKLRIEALSGNI
jgi:dolichol-phosphate mannosyltransferase